METSCTFSCEAVYKCSCGVFMCDHIMPVHLGRGHNIQLLPETVSLNKVMSIISQKKREVFEVSRDFISEIQKLASEQFVQLKKLRKEAIDSSNISQTKEMLSQIHVKNSFTQLMNRLSFSTELRELRSQIEQIKNSSKDEKRILENKVADLTDQLSETKNKVRSKNQEIQKLTQYYQREIVALKQELQNTKEDHKREKEQLNRSFSIQFQELRHQIEQKTIASQKLINELEESKKQEVNELNQTITALKKQLQEAKEDHKNQKSQLDQKVDELTQTNTGLEKKLRETKQDHSYEKNQLNHKIQILNQKIESENQRIQGIKTRITSLVEESKTQKVQAEEILSLELELDGLDIGRGYCLNSLGFIYGEIQNYARSEHCYLRSIKIGEDLLGPESIYLASTYHNLGLLYKKMNHYSKAEKYYLKCLRIEETSIPRSTCLAQTYHNLGVFYEEINHYIQGLSRTEFVKTFLDYRGMERYSSVKENCFKAENFYLKSLRIKKMIDDPTTENTRKKLMQLKDPKGCIIF